MRSQGKGREGSQQDPGSPEGGVGRAWLELGCEHSYVCAGLSLATGGLWSHLMVQLQPHLRVCVAHGSICIRSGGTAGQGSESLRAGAPALHPGGGVLCGPPPF